MSGPLSSPAVREELHSVHESLNNVGRELLDALNSLHVPPNVSTKQNEAPVDRGEAPGPRAEKDGGPTAGWQRDMVLSDTRERLANIGSELRSAVEGLSDHGSPSPRRTPPLRNAGLEDSVALAARRHISCLSRSPSRAGRLSWAWARLLDTSITAQCERTATSHAVLRWVCCYLSRAVRRWRTLVRRTKQAAHSTRRGVARWCRAALHRGLEQLQLGKEELLTQGLLPAVDPGGTSALTREFNPEVSVRTPH